jgi:hypothetical protein
MADATEAEPASRRQTVSLVAAGLMGLFIALIILLADTRNLGILGEAYEFPHGDKIGHFVLYGLLSLLLTLAVIQLLPRQPSKRLALLTSLGLIAVISVEELSQIWLPARKPDWFDLAASYAGIAAFSTLALWWTARDRVVPDREPEA